MLKRPAFIVLTVALLGGCASVPIADQSQSTEAKLFALPSTDKAGLYVYRDSNFGAALKKDIFIDGKCLGESAPKTFFYKEVQGNQEHTISTESEFSPNDLVIYMKAGVNYFVRQYIKLGVFVGGANLEQVSDQKGKDAVGDLKLAVSGNCSK
ncbi:DUF2846 domain-containing protein [Dokdonella sp.]|uniref:DUF2846 domain-containing protein n=1 Tax=Dokdonella sp. TaxID=2291710 RepID=UPI00352941D9